MGKPIEITEQNFEEVVLQSDKPVLIDFWAAWCGPCRAIAPIIEDLANEMDGKAVVGKVDVDHNRNIAIQYGIMNIPTLLVFKDGQVVEKQVGLASKAVLTDKVVAHA